MAYTKRAGERLGRDVEWVDAHFRTMYDSMQRCVGPIKEFDVRLRESSVPWQLRIWIARRGDVRMEGPQT